MLYSFGHNKEFSFVEGHITISQTNRDPAFEDEEKVVGFVMLMPNKLALEFNHHEIVTVELTDGSRLPALSEGTELLREIDCGHFTVARLVALQCHRHAQESRRNRGGIISRAFVLVDKEILQLFL